MNKKASSKTYWFKETDDAIFNYINEEDDYIRGKIYEEHIHKPLSKLIDFSIFKLNVVKYGSPERDADAFRATCFEKFFIITTPNSNFIKKEKGRPFNFLTSVMRNHILGYIEEIQKRKKKIETNYFENEEYVFSEKVNHLGQDNYSEIILEEEQTDSGVIYSNVMKLIEKDISCDNFTSKKEKLFAEQLIIVMKNGEKFGEFGWYNKFFIKLIMRELTDLPKGTVNYYLKKIGKRYISMAYDM